MYVYSFPFLCACDSVTGPVTQKFQLYNTEEGKLSVDELLIVVTKRNGSVREFLDTGRTCFSAEPARDCRIFVASPERPLTSDELTSVSGKVSTLQTDIPDITMPRRSNFNFRYSIRCREPSVYAAISAYRNIHIHYAFYSDGYYAYANSASVKNSLSPYDDTVRYVRIEQRAEWSPYHGRVNEDGSVDIFEYLDEPSVPHVYILRSHWQLLGDRNKVAFHFDPRSNCSFWIVTTQHFAISDLLLGGASRRGTRSITPFFTPFSANTFDNDQIAAIKDLFMEHGFGQVEWSDSFVMSTAKDVVMFTGVCTDARLGKFVGPLADLLME